MGMGWVLGGFVVFSWDPVEISLSIRFEGKSRVYEDESNTIEQPDACSMDAISRGDLAWVCVQQNLRAPNPYPRQVST